MQYKIPQNVQIEDKIVGPLTLKQLVIAGVGGGISYAIYVVLAKSYYWEIWLVPTLIPALFTLALIFLKPNGISFGKWLFLVIEYFVTTRKRTFVMGGADLYSATLFAEKKTKAKTETTGKADRDRERLEKISEISKSLDTYSTSPKTS